jgi:saccharopine dehydrogenase-like NADP-dependent oxidoreductase
MRAIVLGAAGAVGSQMVAGLRARGHEDVVAADRDPSGAREVAHRHGAEHAAVDVLDREGLALLLRGADVVLSAVGPFYRFGTTVLRAAIDSGTTYVDVADDPAPTLEMLALDPAARAAGVSAVVGAGASPGLSNLLAVAAARELHSTARVVTAWPEDPVADLAELGSTASAATEHWVHQMTRDVPALRGRRLTLVRPLTAITLDVPGRRTTAWTVGHPEAVTLHLALRELEDSTNAMLLRPGDAEILVQVAAAVAGGLDERSGARLLRERFADAGPDRGLKPGLGALLAVASGTRDGGPCSALATLLDYPAGGMGAITGLPAVIAAELLAERPALGVAPPEVALEPDEVFRRLLQHVGATTTAELVSVEVFEGHEALP